MNVRQRLVMEVVASPQLPTGHEVIVCGGSNWIVEEIADNMSYPDFGIVRSFAVTTNPESRVLSGYIDDEDAWSVCDHRSIDGPSCLIVYAGTAVEAVGFMHHIQGHAMAITMELDEFIRSGKTTVIERRNQWQQVRELIGRLNMPSDPKGVAAAA